MSRQEVGMGEDAMRTIPGGKGYDKRKLGSIPFERSELSMEEALEGLVESSSVRKLSSNSGSSDSTSEGQFCRPRLIACLSYGEKVGESGTSCDRDGGASRRDQSGSRKSLRTGRESSRDRGEDVHACRFESKIFEGKHKGEKI